MDPFLSTRAVDELVRGIADDINRDRGPEEPLTVVPILTGAMIFAADLVRHLRMPVEIRPVRVESYAQGETTPGTPILSALNGQALPKGRTVLIVDDIADTGQTMRLVRDLFDSATSGKVYTAALLDKPMARRVDLTLDYRGVTVPRSVWVAGYGMDAQDGFGRALPYVFVDSPL